MGTVSRLERKNLRPCYMCETLFSKSLSQCPACLQMNIEVEMTGDGDGTILLTDAKEVDVQRISTGCWDEVWGSHKVGKVVYKGLVDTSVTLLGGAPGAGKSTLSLQMAAAIAKATKREILYIAGEESAGEIRARANRLGIAKTCQNLFRLVPMGTNTVNLDAILEQRKPAAVFLDSIPTIMPDPADAVEKVTILKHFAINNHSPIVIVDHVTKEEEFAGLMSLQHAVDTAVLFTVHEDGVRQIKATKNRNGPTGIVVDLNMTEEGLTYRDPSEDEDDEEDPDWK